MVNVLTTWRGWSGAERAAGAAVALAGAGLVAWAFLLWGEWGRNPDLSHGFLALPAVWLLWRRAREDAARSRGLPGAVLTSGAVAGGAGLLAAGLFFAVYATALGWQSTPTLFLAGGVAAAGLGLAGWLAAGRSVRWIAAGWPACVMIAVVLLSGPLPPATYAKLTAGLQELITIGVVDTLRFFGIPALRAGNIIHLGATSVGVEEACSGVRSLVSCVLAGLVLSALMVRSPWRRAWLVGLAAPLALVMNFGRSLALTLLARNGVDIAGAWHDGLGFAVLGVTTVLLAWLATALEEHSAPATDGAVVAREPRGWVTGSAVGLACLGLAAGWIGWLAARPAQASVGRGMPELERIVPDAPVAGWEVATRPDLERFAGILRTEHLLERSYSKIDDKGRRVSVTVYVAWWSPGAASVSAVAAHTPEACWPGTGWVADPEASARRELELEDGRRAASAEQRAFVNQGYPQTVWFWHLVDGRPSEPFEPRSWREQLRMFFRHGVRGETEQAFVRVSSNLSWEELAGEPLVAEVLEGFAEMGVPLTRAR